MLKLQQRFRSKAHNPFAESVNNIELSSNDDESLQVFDGISSNSYSTSREKMCQTKLLQYLKIKIQND